MEPITGLAYGRIVIGALSLLAPTATSKLFMLDPEANPQLAYMGRMFGSREIALGVITLASSGDARRRLVQLGIAVDAADSCTGVITAASGAVPRKAGLTMGVLGLSAVVAGIMELQQG